MEQNELTAQIVLEYERVISDFVNIVQEAQQAAAAITETFNTAFNEINKSIERSANTIRGLNKVTEGTTHQWRKAGLSVRSFIDLVKVAFTEIIKLANPIDLVVGGFKGLLSVLSDIIVTIGRIRVTINTLFKGFLLVVKTPFTLVTKALDFVRNSLDKVFKAFEWFQYQLFMQFMNIWLVLKVFGPLFDSFLDYNREIYNAWSLINDKVEETSYRLTVMGNELTNIVDIMGQAGLSLATKFGEAPLNVAKAFYDALSAGIAVSDMFYTVEQSMKAARAGVTSVDVALKGGIQAMYAFGLKAQNLTEIFDAQFEAVKIGIIRYEELVSVMGRVYQSAASLGGQLERLKETYYSIAFLTRVGLSPEMGAFGLARLYEELANPDTIRGLEELGVRAYDLRGEFRGLLPVIKDLTNSLAGFSTEAQERMLTAIGFDMRAIRVLRAMVNNFSEYSRIAHQYEEEVGGAMESAYEKQIKSVSFAVDKLKASWEAFKISIVDAASGTLRTFSDVGVSLLNFGSMVVKKYKDLIANFTKFVSLFYGSFAVLALISGIIKGILTPFGLLSSAFAVLIYQAQQGTKFFEAFSKRFPLIGSAAQIAAIGIQQLVNAFTQDKLELIPVIFANIGKSLLGLFAQIPAVQRLYATIMDFYNSLIEFIQGIDTITIPILARKFGNILNAIIGVIKEAIKSIFNLDECEGDITDFARKVLVTVYDSIMEMFSGIFGTEHRMTLPDLLLEFGVIFGLYIKTPEGKYKFNATGVSKFMVTVLKMALENVLRILRGWDFVLLIAELKFVFSAIKLLFSGQLISTITRAAGSAGGNAIMAQLLEKIGFGIKAGTAAFLITDVLLRILPEQFQEWVQKHRVITVFVELALATSATIFAQRISVLISKNIGTYLFPMLLSAVGKMWPWALLGVGAVFAITKLASIFGKKMQEHSEEALDTVYDTFADKELNLEHIRSKVMGELNIIEAATIESYSVLEEEHNKVQELTDVYRERTRKLIEDMNLIEKVQRDIGEATQPSISLSVEPNVMQDINIQGLKQKTKELEQSAVQLDSNIEATRDAAETSIETFFKSSETAKTTAVFAEKMRNELTAKFFPQVYKLTEEFDNISKFANKGVKQIVVSDQQIIADLGHAVEELSLSVHNMDVDKALEKIAKVRARINELRDKFENQYKEVRKVDPSIDSSLERMEGLLDQLYDKTVKIQIGLTGDISLFLKSLAESMGIALDTDLEQQAELTAEEIKRRIIEGTTNIVERAFGEQLWRSIFEGFLLNIQDIFDISIGELGEVTIGAYKYEPSEVVAKKAITSLVSFAQQNFGTSFRESTGMLFDDVFNKTVIEPMAKFINSVREQLKDITKPEKRKEVTECLNKLEKTVAEIQKAVAEGAWEDVQSKINKMLDLAYKTLSETDKKRLQEFGELVKNIDNMFIQYGDDFVKIMKNMLHIKIDGAKAVRAVLYMAALKSPEAVKDLLDKFVSGQKAVLSAIEDMRSTVEEQENQMVNDVLKELLGISVEIEEIPSVEETEWQAIAEFAMQNLSAEVLKQLKELLGIQEDNIKALALGLQQGYEEGLTIVKDLVKVYYSSKAVEASKKLLGSLIQKYFGQENILQNLALEAGLTPQDELKKAMDDFINQFEDLYNEGNEVVIKYVNNAKAMYDELQRMIQAGELQGENLDKSIKGFIGFLELLTFSLQRLTGKMPKEKSANVYKDVWQKWQNQVRNVLHNQINFAQIFVEQILDAGLDLENFVKGLGTTQEKLLKILQAQGYAEPDETLLGALKRQVQEGNQDIIDFILGNILKPTINRLLGDVIKVLHESGTDILAELIAGISREEFDKELEDARRRAKALMEKNKALSVAILRSLDDIEVEASKVGGNFAAAAMSLVQITSILDIIYNVEGNLLSDIKNRLEQTRNRLRIKVTYLSQGFDQISFTTQDIAALIDAYGEDFKEWIRKLADKHEMVVTDIVETAKVLAQEDVSIAQEMEELLEPIWREEFLKSLREVYAEHGLGLPTEIDSVKRDINNQLSEIRDMLSDMSEQDKKNFEQELEALQDEYARLDRIVSREKRLFQLKEFKNHLSNNVLPRAREAKNNWNDVLNKQKQLQNSVDQKLQDLESIKLNIEEIFNIPLHITDKVVEEVRKLFTPEEWKAVWGEIVSYEDLDVAKLQKLAEVDPKAKEMLKNIIKKQAKEQVQADLEAFARNISDEGKRALAEVFDINTLDVLKVKLQRYREEYKRLLPPESKRRADYGKILQHLFDKMEEAIKEDQLAVAQEYAAMIEKFLQFIQNESEGTASEIQNVDFTQIAENYEKISNAISNALNLLRTALQKGYDFIIEKFGNDITNLVNGFKSGVSQGYMNLMDQITEVVEMAATKETTVTFSEKLITESGRKAVALAQERIESLLYAIDISYTTTLKEMNALAQHIEDLQRGLGKASESDRERIKHEIEQASLQYQALDIEAETLEKVYTELVLFANGVIQNADDLSQETKAFLLEYGTRLREALRIEQFEEAYVNLKNVIKAGLYTTLNNFLDDLRRAFADVQKEMDIDDLVQEQLSQIPRNELPLVVNKLSDAIQSASGNVVSQLVNQYTSDLDKLLSLAQVRGNLTEGDVRETLTNVWETWRTSFSGILSTDTLNKVKEYIDEFIAKGQFDIISLEIFVSTLREYVYSELETWIQNNFEAIRDALEAGDISQLTDEQKKFLLILFDVYGTKIKGWVSETRDAIEGVNFRGVFDPKALFNTLENAVGQINMDFVQWLRDFQVDRTSKVDYIMESLSGAIDVMYVQLFRDIEDIQKKYGEGTQEWIDALQSLSEKYGVEILDPQTKKIRELSKAEFIAIIRAHIEELLEILSKEGEITETRLAEMGSWVIPLLKLLQAVFGDLAEASQDIASMLEDIDFGRFIDRIHNTMQDTQELQTNIDSMLSEVDSDYIMDILKGSTSSLVVNVVDQIMEDVKVLEEDFKGKDVKFERELARLSQEYGINLVKWYKETSGRREALQTIVSQKYQEQLNILEQLLQKGDREAIINYLSQHQELAQLLIDIYQQHAKRIAEGKSMLDVIRRRTFDIPRLYQDINDMMNEINGEELWQMLENETWLGFKELANQVTDEIRKAQYQLALTGNKAKYKAELETISKKYGIDAIKLAKEDFLTRDIVQQELQDKFKTQWNEFMEVIDTGSVVAIQNYLAEHEEFAQLIVDIYRNRKQQIEEAERKLKEKDQAAMDAFNALHDALMNFLTALGETVPEFKDTTDKMVQTLNTVLNMFKAIIQLQQVISTAVTLGAISSSIGGLFTSIGAILIIATGIMQLFNLFNSSQEEETEAIQSHLSALERNTVALEALTDILSRMRATLYNAPSEFGYAFVPASTMAPAMVSAGVPASVTVTVNVNGQGGIPDSDIDKIARAVESSVRRVY